MQKYPLEPVSTIGGARMIHRTKMVKIIFSHIRYCEEKSQTVPPGSVWDFRKKAVLFVKVTM